MRIVLSLLSHLALFLAILALFFENSKRLSAGATCIWLVLEAVQLTWAMPWSWGVLAILLLNLRGVVLDEGPTPVSHMDFVLMITAFLVGFGRPRPLWLWSSAVVATACTVGVIINAEIIRDFAWWGVEYHTALLTKNQTALLAGMATLCALMAGSLGRSISRWWLVAMATCGLTSLLLAWASTSRAAIALIPISIVMALLLCSSAMSDLHPLRRFRSLTARQRWIAVSFLLLAALALLAGLFVLILNPQHLASLYGGENMASDVGRLKVWRCYLGLPFLGENRFIYGVGYANSWLKWCSPDMTGRYLYHAHNLLLQIWGDTGVIPTIFIVICLALIFLRMLRNCEAVSLLPSKKTTGRGRDWAMPLASSAMAMYLFSFQMVELGLLKVPTLTALFGFLMASVFHDLPNNPRPLPSDSPSDTF